MTNISSNIMPGKIGGLRPPTMPGMGKTDGASGAPFADFLKSSIVEVNQMQRDADHAVEVMTTGGDANPAEVLTAVQKADLAFKLMLQVRNKLVGAFDEIKNLRI
jgi:flagellar hook-basal body complex protein FliE